MDYKIVPIILAVVVSSFLGAKPQSDDSFTVPPGKEDCKCEWSGWMENEDTESDEVDLKYETLRGLGYSFCENPDNIQCHNTINPEQPVPGHATCNAKIGFSCPFFCDTYKIRVLCCYCPPKAVGSMFQIQTQNGLGTCLSAAKAASDTTATVIVEKCQNHTYQNWEWTSKERLKNVESQQCLAVSGTTEMDIITSNCDNNNKQQVWKYIQKDSVLQFVDNKQYLNYRKTNQKLRLHTARGSESQWLAFLDIDKTTSLKNLQYPKCSPALVPNENSNMVCTLGAYVSSVCTFSCAFGYSLPVGANVDSKCTDDGEFTNNPPVCEKILCLPELSAASNGNVTCSNSNNLFSTCTFDCNSGYKLSSPQYQLSCYETRKWDYEPPTCERIICEPNITTEGLENGKINCTNVNFHSSVCKHTCNTGFELIGPSKRECQLSGKWNDSKPICQKIKCPGLVPPSNGMISCDDESFYSSNCKFDCNVGYTMIGSGSATCNSDKTWTTDIPKCQRQECNALDSPSHGKLKCTDSNFYNSACSFTCDYGYNLEGENTLKCTEAGWDKGAPTCLKITCKELPDITSGSVSCNNTENYKSVCTFSCTQGFKIPSGTPNKLQCEDGGWDNDIPTCIKMSCPVVTSPQNGFLSCPSGNNYNSICYTTCNTGYVLDSPTPIIQCLGTEKWSGAVPTCKKIQCRKLSSLRSGTITCSDSHNFNSTCTFGCIDGYNLFGSNKATCQANGWDSEMPNCAKRSCNPPLARPYNGQIDCDTSGAPKCTFSCNVGYTLVGEVRSVCQADETWSNTETRTCIKIQCSTAMRSPSNGVVKCTDGKMYDSKCTFTCDMGYQLQGDETITCTESKTWSGAAPSCKRISCPEKAIIPNGSTKCSEENFYLSKCDVTCNQGYKLVGSKSSKCQLNSTWTMSNPVCERIMCSPVFTNPSNGNVACSDTNNYGSSCTFSCAEGFTLKGSSSTICRGSGWSNSKPPQCTKIICPEPTPSGNTIGFCDRANEYLSKCTYSCNKGYKLQGSKTRKCLDTGRWSTAEPTCKKIECPVLNPIKNGAFYCQGNELDSNCYFYCDEGYKRKGESSSTCTENGTWSSKLPRCDRDPAAAVVEKTTKLTTTTKPTTTSTTLRSTTTPTTTTATTTTVKTVESTILPPTTKKLFNTTQTGPNSFVGLTTNKKETTGTISPKFQTKMSEESVTVPNVIETDGITETDKVEGDFPIIVVIIVSVVVVFLILLGVIYLIWKRQSKKKPSFTTSIALNDNRYENTEFGPLIPNGTNGNGSMHIRGAKYSPIPIDRLESEYNKRRGDDDKLFREEFHSFQEGVGSKEAGGKAHNKDKNRYTNILPYDHSRVKLPLGQDDESDYINASFIDGYKHKGKFIAAQGPKLNTIDDFWHMIWGQNVSVIIMVTNLDERNEEKCARYWPMSGREIYDDIAVSVVGENHLVDFSIRRFSLQQCRGESTMSMTRNLTQYHFTSWPDFGVPKTPSGMLKFIRRIKHDSPPGFGSMVVHCSAGVGRTGTFIAIDAMMDMLMSESKIDVHSFVSNMRQQRPEMVQTEQQYIFIYQAMLEHHLYGDTEVEVNEVSSHIDELMQRLPGNVTGMEHEFKKLTSIRIQKENMRAGNNPANMRKNRVILTLPYDSNRVILPMKRGQENTDYINASYIDGYRQKDAYIATQGPLPHTVEDFWRMVWNVQAASIVMLTELVEKGQAKCALYWPNDGTEAYGDLRVEKSTEVDKEDYTEREFILSNALEGPGVGRQQVVKQFHYHGWPEVGSPSSGYGMITLIEDVQRQQQSSGNHPIVIHCSGGAGRTGAFCALITALEQVKAEGVLDIFQIVKCLRIQRPHMVQNLEQYEFCYRTVQEYIDSMSEYYNFK